jgi:hypothetical protein
MTQYLLFFALCSAVISYAEPADGGIFGKWIQDSFGLPAFSWEMNEREDDRAVW